MLYKKYGEIPLYEYLSEVHWNPTIKITSITTICKGLTTEMLEHPDFIFDKYYLEYAQQVDPLNFI